MQNLDNVKVYKYVTNLREPLETKRENNLLIPLDVIKYKRKFIYIYIFTTYDFSVFQVMLMKDRNGRIPYNTYHTSSSSSYIDKKFLSHIKLRISTYKIIKYLLNYKSESNKAINFLDTEKDIMIYLQGLAKRLGFHIYKSDNVEPMYRVIKRNVSLIDIS